METWTEVYFRSLFIGSIIINPVSGACFPVFLALFWLETSSFHWSVRSWAGVTRSPYGPSPHGHSEPFQVKESSILPGTKETSQQGRTARGKSVWSVQRALSQLFNVTNTLEKMLLLLAGQLPPGHRCRAHSAARLRRWCCCLFAVSLKATVMFSETQEVCLPGQAAIISCNWRRQQALPRTQDALSAEVDCCIRAVDTVESITIWTVKLF